MVEAYESGLGTVVIRDLRSRLLALCCWAGLRVRIISLPSSAFWYWHLVLLFSGYLREAWPWLRRIKR